MLQSSYSELMSNPHGTLGELTTQGYNGKNCIFRVVFTPERKEAIIIQAREHEGTSITNLADKLAQALQYDSTKTKVYEYYEGQAYVDEIKYDKTDNHVTWIPVAEEASGELIEFIAEFTKEYDLSLSPDLV